MAKIQRNFIKGRMNKSVDERLVPQGEYIDALNIRLGSSEGNEIGAVENSKGNDLLVQVKFSGNPLSSNAKCIGAYEDGANETIYWFITDPTNIASTVTGKVDMIVSFNTKLSSVFYHVISTSVLNFDSKYLINGINLIDGLLFFTDNLNPPRKININRTYLSPVSGVDNVTEQDIGVILAPPLNSPIVEQFNLGGGQNYMEELFLSFAYRWQYQDGEYSAISPFSQTVFSPGPFRLDYNTFDNAAMVNSFNSVKVTFETGGRNVVAVDVLFKFSTSQNVNVIERFKKSDEGWSDNDSENITFTNKKIFTALPAEQLLRLFDNVPRIAQAQTLMGNRLMYGNYVDGYDVANSAGKQIDIDYDLTLISNTLSSDEIEATKQDRNYNIGISTFVTDSIITIDFGGLELIEGAQIGVEFNYKGSIFNGDTSYFLDGNQPKNEFVFTFLFNLQRDYLSVNDLATSPEFITAVSEFVDPSESSCFDEAIVDGITGSSLTDIYNCQIGTRNEWVYDAFGITETNQGFIIGTSPNSNSISFTLPALRFQKLDLTDPNNPVFFNPPVLAYEYISAIDGVGLYSKNASKKSLHSNRDYEVAIVYMDEYGRSSTALVDTDNTIFIPCSNSVDQNNIRVQLNNFPPYWATKYKFVIKESEGEYRTIYSQIFFQEQETGDVWFKLEGDNRDKIKDNEILYVKTDTTGPVLNCASTKVLAFESQIEDFLCEKDANGQPIDSSCQQPAGTYMKLKPSGFNASAPANSFIQREDGNTGGNGIATVSTSLEDTTVDPSEFAPYDIPAGSIIQIKLDTRRNKRGSKCGGRIYAYDKTFTASNDYNSLYDWAVGDNIDFTNGITSGSDDTQNVVSFDQTIYDYPQSSSTGPGGDGQTVIFFQQGFSSPGVLDGKQYMSIQTGTPACGGIDVRNSFTSIETIVTRASTLMVFETEPTPANDELYYENEQTFDIVNGFHLSGDADADQDQTASLPAIIDLTFFNCYTFGNGVESDRILDALTKPSLSLGEKVTSVAEEQYREIHRFSDVTYSGNFNQETNLNKLNQFNLALANFKTLETSYGPIRKMHARQTDILTLQEDKISYLLVEKNLLSDASGGGALTSVPQVLGKQVARTEEYGISNNPESFSSYGPDVYFTDAKRSSVINIKGESEAGRADKLSVISQVGMRSWFRDLFLDSFETQKLGAFDPYMNEYVLSSNDVLLPQIPVSRNCGYTLLQENSTSVISFDLDCTSVIGEVDIDYDISSINGVNISVDYNGVNVLNTNVLSSGTVSFTKSQTNPILAQVTITPIGEATYEMTFGCPQAEQLTVTQIVINFEGEASKTTTTRYKWELSGDSSPYNTNSVVLEDDGISLFESQTNQESFGSIPAEGATVTMQSRQVSGQTFDFDPLKDKFKYLVSNVQYTEATINTLIPLLNTATPISGGPLNYESSFVYNNVSNDNYLYLVWDFRSPTLINLCYDQTSELDACCDCISTTQKYINSDDFLTATSVYNDSNLTVLAPDGFYQSGGRYRQQISGVLESSRACDECSTRSLYRTDEETSVCDNYCTSSAYDMDVEFTTNPARDYENLTNGDAIVGGLQFDGFYAVSPYVGTTGKPKNTWKILEIQNSIIVNISECGATQCQDL